MGNKKPHAAETKNGFQPEVPFSFELKFNVELYTFISMAAVRFVLRDTHASGKTLVMLTFSYKGKRLRLSSGISTLVKDWDIKRQRFIENAANPSFRELNLFLDLLASQLTNRYNQWLVQHRIPDIQTFKKYIKETLIAGNQKGNDSFFWILFDEFIAEKRLEVKNVTDYDKALRKHLHAYEEFNSLTLTLDDIHQRKSGFAKQFTLFLSMNGHGIHHRNGLSVNTIGKQFKNLKVFLKWCFDNDRYPPFSLSHLVTINEPVHSIYLTDEELGKLEKLKLIGFKKIVRDLFLIGCETGLRYSDYSRLQRAWIISDTLYITPIKTMNQPNVQGLIIPLSGRFKRIMKHYPEEFPNLGRSQLFHFNTVLRELGEEAKIADLVQLYKSTNTGYDEEQVPKFSLLSSHTARRTFCTLKFLAGMPVESIMRFSGHTTERNFLKYLRLDNELNAAQFRKFF